MAALSNLSHDIHVVRNVIIAQSALASLCCTSRMACEETEINVIPQTPLPSEADSSESGSAEQIKLECVGVPFLYTIPSFNCISFTISQIAFKAVVDGNVVTYHGFIRHDPTFDMQCHEYPRTIDIFESCFVKVKSSGVHVHTVCG